MTQYLKPDASYDGMLKELTETLALMREEIDTLKLMMRDAMVYEDGVLRPFKESRKEYGGWRVGIPKDRPPPPPSPFGGTKRFRT
jgi:hypothetical protein